MVQLGFESKDVYLLVLWLQETKTDLRVPHIIYILYIYFICIYMYKMLYNVYIIYICIYLSAYQHLPFPPYCITKCYVESFQKLVLIIKSLP